MNQIYHPMTKLWRDYWSWSAGWCVTEDGGVTCKVVILWKASVASVLQTIVPDLFLGLSRKNMKGSEDGSLVWDEMCDRNW